MGDRPRDQMEPARDAAVAAGESLREIGSREVVAYLRAHPDFLEHHPEAVRLLRPPSREIGDGVVDFQHFLFERQKGEVARLNAEYRNLIGVCRGNLASPTSGHKG